MFEFDFQVGKHTVSPTLPGGKVKRCIGLDGRKSLILAIIF